jgi:hypothetical protein
MSGMAVQPQYGYIHGLLGDHPHAVRTACMHADLAGQASLQQPRDEPAILGLKSAATATGRSHTRTVRLPW